MFRKDTTIVIGAGVSNEFSLPTGDQLKEKIAECVRFRFDWNQQTSGDACLLGVLRRHFEHDRVNDFTRAANKLSASMKMFPSIDEALHYHSSNEDIVLLGKLAIAHNILNAEKESDLTGRTPQPQPRVDQVGESWLSQLLSLAISGTKIEEIKDVFSKLIIINFNYDRTVEHYLYWALQQIAGIDAEIAKEAIGRLQIIRPYGSLGPLDWQGANGVSFGGDADLFSLASQIRTYTEQHESELVEQIEKAINDSKLVIFVGFGYHQQNISLFDPREGKRNSDRQIWGTVSGIDNANHQLISNSLQKRLAISIVPRLFDWRASEFFSKLRQSISTAIS